MKQTVKKIDLKRELKHLYQAFTEEVTMVRVPKFNFLMVDGEGGPDSNKDFQDGVQALYRLSYTMKFMCRKEKKVDYPVMALEGLWWMKDDAPFDVKRKEDWRWTLMIMQPKYVTKTLVKKASKLLEAKKDLPALSKIRFGSFSEGLCVQILHVGPYSEEGPSLEKMVSIAREHGYAVCGKHHEIYLSDPRRVKPENLKTVLRHPIQKE